MEPLGAADRLNATGLSPLLVDVQKSNFTISPKSNT